MAEDSADEELQRLMTTSSIDVDKSTRDKGSKKGPSGKEKKNSAGSTGGGKDKNVLLKEKVGSGLLDGTVDIKIMNKDSHWGEKSPNNSEVGSSEENDIMEEMPSAQAMGMRRRPISDTEHLESVLAMASSSKQDLNKRVNSLLVHDEKEEYPDEEIQKNADNEPREGGEGDGPLDQLDLQDDKLRSVSNASNYGSQLNDDSSCGSPDGDDMLPKPKWHPPWQLKQEIVAHESAIPVLIIDPTNRWFATGSSDNLIRIWDIDDYRLKLMIKAHKQSIRSMTFGLARHRYLYSTGDDRQLLCHDVEVNRVISKYKGQSTVIYCMCMHAPSNLLVTGARDKLLRIYDTRTTKCIKQLRGHQNTVSCVLSRNDSDQVVSGSHDGTLRVWDVGEGKCTSVLPGHSKSIRTMCQHPVENIVLSASSERILGWDIDTTEIVQEIPARDIAINSITINRLGVTVAGGSNGVMHLWDFPSGFRFQKIHRTKVYESQEVPICVFSTKFDHSGTKLICSGACNVVKIYQETFTRFRPYFNPDVKEMETPQQTERSLK